MNLNDVRGNIAWLFFIVANKEGLRTAKVYAEVTFSYSGLNHFSSSGDRPANILIVGIRYRKRVIKFS